MSSSRPARGLPAWPGGRTLPWAPRTTERHQLLAVLRGRREGRAVPDRQGRQREPDRPRRGRRLRLARLPADRHPRAALRLPGARPVRPGGRPPLRSEQAAARPVRQVVRRRLRVQPGAVLLRPGGRREDPPRPARRRGRLAGPHHDQRGDQPVLRLGHRPRAAHAVPRDGHLRGARQGHDRRPTRRSPKSSAAPTPAWPTRRSSSTCKSLERHRDRADAGAPVHARPPAAGPGPAKLLGLQHDRVLRPAQPVRRQPDTPAARSPSSRPWSGRCTRRASRSSSTWSTTTPPRATTSAPRSTSAASTTPPTTGSSTTTCSSTRTSPAPATASTPATRTRCS